MMPLFYYTQPAVLVASTFASVFVIALFMNYNAKAMSGVASIGAGVLSALIANRGYPNLITSAVAGGTVASGLWILIAPHFLSVPRDEQQQELQSQCYKIGLKLFLGGCFVSVLFVLVLITISKGDINPNSLLGIFCIGVIVGVLLGVPYLLVGFIIGRRQL